MRSLLFRVLTLSMVGMGTLPAARAIPEAEALEKLRVIPVHLLVDAKGVPFPIPRNQSLLLPLYLDRQRAVAELRQVRTRYPSLRVANGIVAGLKKDLKPGYTLSAPVVPRRQDLDMAATLLRQQGLADRQIRQGLTVPVFYARPFLTTSTPQGERGLLFLSYEDLRNALARQSGSPARRVEVADITAVLRRLTRTPQDLFVFHAPQAGGASKRERQAPPPPPPL